MAGRGKDAQIDKGTLRIHVSKGQKKVLKKLHKKRLRKTPDDRNPQSNRYGGGWAV